MLFLGVIVAFQEEEVASFLVATTTTFLCENLENVFFFLLHTVFIVSPWFLHTRDTFPKRDTLVMLSGTKVFLVCLFFFSFYVGIQSENKRRKRNKKKKVDDRS
jgi:hypothetical protein